MGGEGVPQGVHLSMCLPSHTHIHTHKHSQGRKIQSLKQVRKPARSFLTT